MFYKIKEIADIAGISIRMLRHYDKIGLFKPDCLSSSGYRLYSEDSLDKLLQILFFRELDFGLPAIKEILDDPNYNKKQILEAQEKLLLKKKDRLEAITRVIRKTIDTLEDGTAIHNSEVFTVFHMAEMERNKEKLALDFKLKFGDVLQDKCGSKTDTYNAEDWTITMSKAGDILRSISSYLGESYASTQVQNEIEKLHQFLNDKFWTCTPAVFKVLADLYVNDPVFRGYVESYHPKLPEFIRDAIYHYCDKWEVL